MCLLPQRHPGRHLLPAAVRAGRQRAARQLNRQTLLDHARRAGRVAITIYAVEQFTLTNPPTTSITPACLPL